MNSIKILAPLVPVATVILALTSCARDAAPRMEQDASFVVDQPMSLVKSEQSATTPGWSIPSKNSMTFSACIKDVAKLEPVISQKFAIHSETGTLELTTNAEGCLSWSEEVPFNYLQDETYVESTHKIEGLGPYLGNREVDLALDPWKTSSDAMVDLRQNPSMQKMVSGGHSVIDSLKAAIITGVSKPSQIRVNTLNIDSNDIRFSGNTADVDLRLNLSPTLSRTDLTGNLLSEPIMQGKFTLDLYLTERVQTGAQSGEGDQVLILAQSTQTGTLDSSGRFAAESNLSLTRLPNPASILELAFKLTPLDAPYTLSAEEGVGRIGPLSSFRGQGSLTVTHPDFAAYLNQSQASTSTFQSMAQSIGILTKTETSDGTSETCKDGSDELGYYISNLTVQWTGVKSRTPNEQVPSESIASVMVCLSNSVDRTPLTGHQFDIDFEGSPVQNLTADNLGCVRWNEAIGFDYFSPEKWIEKRLEITSVGAPFQLVKRSFPIYVDPWQTDQTFFWDCRKGALPTFQSKPAQIEISDFAYSFVGRDLNIDSNLNLTITHRFQLEVTPQFHRSVGYGGLSTYETVNDGRYHMRVVLLSPNQDESFSIIDGASNKDIVDNFKYLSSYEGDVQTRNGRIIEEVPLPIDFTAIPLLQTRNVILLQISPIESSSSLVSQPFYTPILTNVDYGTFGLSPSKGASTYQNTAKANEQMKDSKLNLDSLIRMGKASQAKNAPSLTSENMIKTQFGVKQATLAQLNRAGLTYDSIHALMSSSHVSPENAIKICNLIGIAQATCAAHAQGTFEVLRSAHVESLTGTPQVVGSNYKTLTLSATMTFSESSTHTLSAGGGHQTNTAITANGGVGVSLFGFAKLGEDASFSKGKNWFDSSTDTKNIGVTDSQTNGLSRNFSVEQMTFSIPTTNHLCMTIRPSLKARAPSRPELMICEPAGSRTEAVTETYAVLTEILGYTTSTFRDPHSVSDSPWVKVVRGAPALDALIKSLSDQSKEVLLTPATVAEIPDPTSSNLGAPNDARQEANFAKTAPARSDNALPGVDFLSKVK